TPAPAAPTATRCSRSWSPAPPSAGRQKPRPGPASAGRQVPSGGRAYPGDLVKRLAVPCELCLSLCGDAFCAGEMRRQELSGSVERSGPFVEDRREGLKDVRHPRGDVEDDLDIGGSGLSREADSVVEENLVRSDLDDQGRQAG